MIVNNEYPDGLGPRRHRRQNTDHQRPELAVTEGSATGRHRTNEMRSTHVPTLCDGGPT